MKKISFIFTLLFLLTACKAKRVVTTKKNSKPRIITAKRPKKSKNNTTSPSNNTFTHTATQKIINKAVSYKGTKYKYGGTTKRGMDCSGLMFVAFKAGNIQLPRTAFEQSKKGKKISIKNIRKGDLVFFKTSRKNRINHVGLVVNHKQGNVKFVHASTSRGVMISSLKDGYWANTFAFAKHPTAPKNTSKTTTDTTKTYTVKKGDTFYAIARKFKGISAQDIMTFNHLSAFDLKPGMILNIPK